MYIDLKALRLASSGT